MIPKMLAKLGVMNKTIYTLFRIIINKTFRLCSFGRNDLRERKRKRSEGLDGKVGVISFKGFRGEFRVCLLPWIDLREGE